jgi:hypothetical protein
MVSVCDAYSTLFLDGLKTRSVPGGCDYFILKRFAKESIIELLIGIFPSIVTASRSLAKQSQILARDCFVASLLAMTVLAMEKIAQRCGDTRNDDCPRRSIR